jgi:ferredoxin-type protein NapH
MPSKRQSIRRGILLGSFLLLPVTQFYFSPYLIISGALQGIVVGSFLFFSLLLLGSIFIGRSFCGWFMPCGGLQDACSPVQNRNVNGRNLDLVKWFIWVPWMASIVWAFWQAGGINNVNPLYKIDHGVSVSRSWMYLIYYAVVLIFVVLSITIGKRAACHSVCWMSPFMILGRKLRNTFNTPALMIRTDPTKCITCKRCEKSCPMSLNVSEMALSGRFEHSECILCGECVDICPKHALCYGFGEPEKLITTNIHDKALSSM